MFQATLGKEVVVRTADETGLLAELAKTVAEKGIDVLAVGGWSGGGMAEVHLVTDDNLRASDALRRRGFNPVEEKVVLLSLPHKPGLLRYVTETLAREQVGVRRLYASVPSGQDRCLLVLDSDDDDRAVAALNREPAPKKEVRHADPARG